MTNRARTLAAVLLPLGLLFGSDMIGGSPMLRAQGTAAQRPRPMAIVGANLVDLAGGPPLADAVIVVDGDRIAAIGPAASTPVPPGADVIRAGGAWILPGLMNLHVHLGLALPGQREAAGRESDAALGFRMAVKGREALRAGVTTVRLVGDRGHIDLDLKKAIDRGDIEGPRIFSAGQLLMATGGHGSDDEGAVEADGPAEFRKATRGEIKAGAEWIKITISGGISDARGEIGAAHMTSDEIAAVTDIAHRLGVRVTAHSGSPVATRDAVTAGVDCIEHGYVLPDDVLRQMVTAGTWLVPTIVVSRPESKEFYDKVAVPPWFMGRVAVVGEQHWRSLQDAIKAGVHIAVGTDMLPAEPLGGTNATIREIEYYVAAGMTPLQALRAATIEPATLLKVSDSLGSVTIGKLADLIAIRENPLSDISALRSVRLVIKNGRVVRNDLAEDAR